MLFCLTNRHARSVGQNPRFVCYILAQRPAPARRRHLFLIAQLLFNLSCIIKTKHDWSGCSVMTYLDVEHQNNLTRVTRIHVGRFTRLPCTLTKTCKTVKIYLSNTYQNVQCSFINRATERDETFVHNIDEIGNSNYFHMSSKLVQTIHVDMGEKGNCFYRQ